MKFVLSFSIIFLTLEPTVFGDGGGGARVYRGYPKDISDAPWMVYVRYMTYTSYGVRIDYLCGGTIVNKMYILTAGHCVTDKVQGAYKKRKASLYEIRVGSTYFNEGGSIYKVAQVYPHPRYTPASPAHDMGLLKLTKNIRYNKKTVQNIQLDSSNGTYRSGEDVSSMGWGQNPENPHAAELYEVNLNIVDSAECARAWGGSESEYSKHEICALGPKNADVCQGDSGGPLIYGENNQQIGVVSFGATCAQNDNSLPGAYAKIADNLGWINGVISGKKQEHDEDDC
ncbi:trypsin beta-like [Bradysia coprophila]|uniref:trypsin beta-like n=1 Tax=Bradysia coprophila TaxID=38358 RepID=UPI00187DD940|nr:trypsin beta-like [Bradysia coprophila]